VLTGNRLWEFLPENSLGLALRHPLQQSVYGGQESVFDLDLSGDGRMAATAYGDRVYLWNALTGAQVAVRSEHEAQVLAVRFSPDGSLLASGGNDKVLRLWDGRTGEPIGGPLAHAGPVWRLLFSPDGAALIAVANCGGLPGNDPAMNETTIWNVATLEPRAPPFRQQNSIGQLRVSRNGERLFTCGSTFARVWNMADGTAVTPRLDHDESLADGDIHPDGKWVATACSDNQVRIWSGTSGQLATTLQHASDTAVAFSPDGRLLVTADREGVKFWNVDGWRRSTKRPAGLLQSFRGNIDFSRDGNKLLLQSFDGTQVCDVAGRFPIGPILRHCGRTTLSNDGRRLIAKRGASARIYELPAAMPDEIERLRLWAEVTTGMELTDDGEVKLLAPDQWHRRRTNLERLGGVPLPMSYAEVRSHAPAGTPQEEIFVSRTYSAPRTMPGVAPASDN